MKKIRMCFPRDKTFEDGFKEYVLDCKARNLREGTIHPSLGVSNSKRGIAILLE